MAGFELQIYGSLVWKATESQPLPLPNIIWETITLCNLFTICFECTSLTLRVPLTSTKMNVVSQRFRKLLPGMIVKISKKHVDW